MQWEAFDIRLWLITEIHFCVSSVQYSGDTLIAILLHFRCSDFEGA